MNIIEWKRTASQYVAVLQSMDRFDVSTIRELERHGFETILGGRLLGSERTEWYALAYDRNELEFDEAKALARETLDRYREEQYDQYRSWQNERR